MRTRIKYSMFAILGIIFILAVLLGIGWLVDLTPGSTVMGLTFSDFYAQNDLHLDWKQTYNAILDELKPQKIRLVAYWNRIQPNRDDFDFSNLDYEVRQAEARDIPIILAVGYRVPRWPECHIPDWAASLPKEESRQALFKYMKAVVDRYKDSKDVIVWQVENEPMLGVFGRCPAPDRDFLKQEISFVREADPSRPILTTASGELSLWTDTAGLSEIFGTTLYRYIWNKTIGNFTHIFPPSWYSLRAWYAKRFLGAKEVMIAELQAEPWGEGKPLVEMETDAQVKSFNVAEMESIVRFAKKTGIPEIYVWGPEWWYWRKLNGDAGFWEAGKNIFAR